MPHLWLLTLGTRGALLVLSCFVLVRRKGRLGGEVWSGIRGERGLDGAQKPDNTKLASQKGDGLLVHLYVNCLTQNVHAVT